jgi:hypothetical protein
MSKLINPSFSLLPLWFIICYRREKGEKGENEIEDIPLLVCEK